MDKSKLKEATELLTHIETLEKAFAIVTDAITGYGVRHLILSDGEQGGENVTFHSKGFNNGLDNGLDRGFVEDLQGHLGTRIKAMHDRFDAL